MNSILERGKRELPNKKVLLELLSFASVPLKKEISHITRMEPSSPWQPIVKEKLWEAEGYPSAFDFQSMCVYGRYYEEYGRYFLGVVPTVVANDPTVFPFNKQAGYCYGVVWSEKGDIGLHLVYMGREKVLGAGEDITGKDLEAFATLVDIITQ